MRRFDRLWFRLASLLMVQVLCLSPVDTALAVPPKSFDSSHTSLAVLVDAEEEIHSLKDPGEERRRDYLSLTMLLTAACTPAWNPIDYSNLLSDSVRQLFLDRREALSAALAQDPARTALDRLKVFFEQWTLSAEPAPVMRWSGRGMTDEQHQLLKEAIAEYFTQVHQIKMRRALRPGDPEYDALDPEKALAAQDATIWLLPGLIQRIQELAAERGVTDIPADLCVHPGTSRSQLVMDPVDMRRVVGRNQEWRRAWAAHEAFHIANPLATEADVRRQAPLPPALDGEDASWPVLQELWRQIHNIRPEFQPFLIVPGNVPRASLEEGSGRILLSRRLAELMLVDHAAQSNRSGEILRIDLMLEKARRLVRDGRGADAWNLVNEQQPKPPGDDPQVYTKLCREFIGGVLAAAQGQESISAENLIQSVETLETQLLDYPHWFVRLRALAAYTRQGYVKGEDELVIRGRMWLPGDFIALFKEVYGESGLQDPRLDGWLLNFEARWDAEWDAYLNGREGYAGFVYDKLFEVKVDRSKSEFSHLAPAPEARGIRFRLSVEGLRQGLPQEFERVFESSAKGYIELIEKLARAFAWDAELQEILPQDRDWTELPQAELQETARILQERFQDRLLETVLAYALDNPDKVFFSSNALEDRHLGQWGNTVTIEDTRVSIDDLKGGWTVRYPSTLDEEGTLSWLIAPDLKPGAQPRHLEYVFGIYVEQNGRSVDVLVPDLSVKDPKNASSNRRIEIKAKSSLRNPLSRPLYDRLAHTESRTGALTLQINLDAETPSLEELRAQGKSRIRWLAENLDKYSAYDRLLLNPGTLTLQTLPWLSGYAPAALATEYGTPEDFKALKDAAKKAGIELMYDAVLHTDTGLGRHVFPPEDYLRTSLVREGREIKGIVSPWAWRLDNQNPDAGARIDWWLEAVGIDNLRLDLGGSWSQYLMMELRNRGFHLVAEWFGHEIQEPCDEIYWEGFCESKPEVDWKSARDLDVTFEGLEHGLNQYIKGFDPRRGHKRALIVFDNHDQSAYEGGLGSYGRGLAPEQATERMKAVYAAAMVLHLKQPKRTSVLEYRPDRLGYKKHLPFMYGGPGDIDLEAEKDEEYAAFHNGLLEFVSQAKRDGAEFVSVDTGNPYVGGVEIVAQGRSQVLLTNLSGFAQTVRLRLKNGQVFEMQLAPYQVVREDWDALLNREEWERELRRFEGADESKFEEAKQVLRNKHILEVTVEMALPDALLQRINEDIAEYGELTEDDWRAIAMSTSVGGIGPLLRERTVAQGDFSDNTQVTTVSLLYENVYFQETLEDGSVELVKRPVADKLKKYLDHEDEDEFQLQMFDGSWVTVYVWKVPEGSYGGASGYFLEIPGLTDVVYPGKPEAPEDVEDKERWEKEMRLRQNWALGRASLKLTKVIQKIKPDIVVMSEANALFAQPKLGCIKDELSEDPWFADTLTVFNDHTPLPYAHPLWDESILSFLGVDRGWLEGLPVWVEKDGKRFVDATALIIMIADGVYGVAEKHADVMKDMPELAPFVDKIRAITNGVSPHSWPDEAFVALYQRLVELDTERVLPAAERRMTDQELAEKDAQLDEELLAAKDQKRAGLLRFLAERQKTGDPVTDGDLLEWADQMIVEDNPVVIWDRRLVEYKRVELLADVLENPEMREAFVRTGIVFVFGGRIHQNDNYGKNQYSRIQRALTQDERLRKQIKFFDNFNIAEAPELFRGTNVSVMLADDGREASATGFLKALMNGALIIASWDGAVPEFCIPYDPERQNFGEANAFNVPYERNREDPNQPDRPYAGGFLAALEQFADVYRNHRADGGYVSMMRNALRETPRVSVEQTAKKMWVLFAELIQEQEERRRMQAEARSAARERCVEIELREFSCSPVDAERLLYDAAPFVWKYEQEAT
ncbi:MAG: glycogen/starch/alpha-glucan phosphorylase, partial [Candidatus Omnitrophica bacterium]|nr:glycogen/starch/alpha-glucan phosphorylase [Candidatus Omnitrophota bacterium]